MHKKSRKTPAPFVQFVQDKMCVCVRTHTRPRVEEKSNTRSEKNFFKKIKKIFKKVVDNELTVCYINKAVAKTTATNLEN